MEISAFIGKICPYCKCEFLPGDDIVVCSACDMPHHRDCWVENQGCTTFGCQGTIKSVDGQASSVTAKEIVYDETPARPATVYCARCGAPNASTASFCSKCGSRMVMPQRPATAPVQPSAYQAPPRQPTYQTPPQYNTYQWQSPYQSGAQVTLDPDIERLVGSNTEYYLPKFREMEQQGGKASWNWSAFLFTPFWLIYRKMYGYGFAALGAGFVLSLFGGWLPSMLAMGGYVVFGILGNCVYLHHLKKRAQQGKTLGEPYKTEYMIKNAGVNKAAAVWTAIGYAVLVTIITFV